MAVAAIKIRCGQCKQLMGVPRSKIGAVVNCPRCDARIVVPEPSDEPSPPPPLPTDSSGNAVSLEALDIRVEDIRVEPGVRDIYAATSPPATPPAEPGHAREMQREFPAPDPKPEPEPEPMPAALLETIPEYPTLPMPPALPSAPPPLPGAQESADVSLLPEIRLEPQDEGGRSRRPEAPRSYDLVLPRAVVGSWSLLVLLAVGFAFLAGLLAGHYVWQLH